MPRADTTAVVVPGAYRTLLERECVERTRPDPRLYLNVETDLQQTEWEAMKAGGRRRAALLLLQELLTAGEPIVVPAWRLNRNSVPALIDADLPMLRDRSITQLVVYADDRVAPADATPAQVVLVIGAGVTEP